MDISNRRVAMFRCNVAPLIGPRAQQAYVPKDMGAEAEICSVEEGPVGILIKLQNGQEHVVTFANLESFRLEPEEKKAAKAKV